MTVPVKIAAAPTSPALPVLWARAKIGNLMERAVWEENRELPQQVKNLASSTATTTWAGQTMTGSDTLVMYTYGGDANLDGKIDISDYGRIDFNIPLGTNGWYNGDFNYDGKIDISDYGIIDFNIGIQGTPLSTSSAAGPSAMTAVPEPAAITMVMAAGSLVLKRRGRVKS